MQTRWIHAGVAALALSLGAGSALAQESFEGADRNADGFVDQQEFYEATNGGSHNVYDADGDGMLDENEYIDAMNALPSGGDIDAEQSDVGGVDSDSTGTNGGTAEGADAGSGAETGGSDDAGVADGGEGSGTDSGAGSDTQ